MSFQHRQVAPLGANDGPSLRRSQSNEQADEVGSKALSMTQNQLLSTQVP